MTHPEYAPKEILWETIYDKKGKPIFGVTSKLDRTQYFLYELHDTTAKKVSKAKSPDLFHDKTKLL